VCRILSGGLIVGLPTGSTTSVPLGLPEIKKNTPKRGVVTITWSIFAWAIVDLERFIHGTPLTVINNVGLCFSHLQIHIPQPGILPTLLSGIQAAVTQFSFLLNIKQDSSISLVRFQLLVHHLRPSDDWRRLEGTHVPLRWGRLMLMYSQLT